MRRECRTGRPADAGCANRPRRRALNPVSRGGLQLPPAGPGTSLIRILAQAHDGACPTDRRQPARVARAPRRPHRSVTLVLGTIASAQGDPTASAEGSKHIRLTISDGIFTWSRDEDSIKREAMLDGIYVVRTSEPAERLSAEASVRAYKRLALV